MEKTNQISNEALLNFINVYLSIKFKNENIKVKAKFKEKRGKK